MGIGAVTGFLGNAGGMVRAAFHRMTAPAGVQPASVRLQALAGQYVYYEARVAEFALAAGSMRHRVRCWAAEGVDAFFLASGVAPRGPMPETPLASRIDHTLLKPGATVEQYKQLAAEAREHAMYSVCVPSSMIALCKGWLAGSGVKTITVFGFPHGNTLTASKVAETRRAIRAGADEIDMVLNVTWLKSGCYGLVYQDIRSVVRAAGRTPVKVIIETSLLTEEEKRLACELVLRARAAYAKTNTGFNGGGATVADVRLMHDVVVPFAKVKAAGGVGDKVVAMEMIAAGADRIGASKSVDIVA